MQNRASDTALNPDITLSKWYQIGVWLVAACKPEAIPLIIYQSSHFINVLEELKNICDNQRQGSQSPLKLATNLTKAENLGSRRWQKLGMHTFQDFKTIHFNPLILERRTQILEQEHNLRLCFILIFLNGCVLMNVCVVYTFLL